jgi:hypothetical protein
MKMVGRGDMAIEYSKGLWRDKHAAPLTRKSQIPKTKSQVTLNAEKSQAPKGSAVQQTPFEYWDLEFPWDLEPGIWDF